MPVMTLEMMLKELEQDRSLHEPDQLRRRIEVLDRLETCLIHTPDGAESTLLRQAQAISAELEAINEKLYQSIRRKIQQGAGDGGLYEWATVSSEVGRPLDQLNGVGYDYLDVLVSGTLQFDEPDESIASLAPEMVFYQPTPARYVFDLIRHAELKKGDVLIDLGSGLGHVSLLAAICTPAQCIGIELEAAYVACAKKSALALNVSNVTFIQQDARSADFANGTVFYLYTPFTGTILRDVLDRLKREAADREIRVCTLGPCTLIVEKEPWLHAMSTPEIDQLTIFRSV